MVKQSQGVLHVDWMVQQERFLVCIMHVKYMCLEQHWTASDTLQEQNDCADSHYNEYQSWPRLVLHKYMNSAILE